MIIKHVTNHTERHDAYAVRTKVFVDEQGVSMAEEIDAHEDEALHFVGYKENIPIAASRLRFIDDMGKLERICIMKEQRGKSYGRKIIEAMEVEVQNRGYQKAILNGQTQAIPFYERLGYNVISEEFLDAGIPHVTMIKHLQQKMK